MNPSQTPSCGTKGTAVEYHRKHSVWAKYPATVILHIPGTANSRPRLIVQYDGVAPDLKTFSRNVLGQQRVFVLNKKRRWVSTHWLDRDVQPGRMHFEPGQQFFMDPPF